MILPQITDPSIDYLENPKIPIKNGDIVRFLHPKTDRYLITHDVASALTWTYQEATAVPCPVKNHPNYPYTLWKMDIVKGGDFLKSKVVSFRLYNIPLRMNLINIKGILPAWGSNHREVNTGGDYDERAWWTIDYISNEENKAGFENKTKMEEVSEYRLNFWEKFFETLVASIENSSNFRVDSTNQADPMKWPFLVGRTKLWNSKDGTQKIYLQGNVLAWLTAIAAMPIFIGLLMIDHLFQLREVTFLTQTQRRFMYSRGLFFLTCYLLHYLPFIIYEKATSLHHYLPSYLFSALIFTTLYQTLALKFSILHKPAVIGIICSLIAGIFIRSS